MANTLKKKIQSMKSKTGAKMITRTEARKESSRTEKRKLLKGKAVSVRTRTKGGKEQERVWEKVRGRQGDAQKKKMIIKKR